MEGTLTRQGRQSSPTLCQAVKGMSTLLPACGNKAKAADFRRRSAKGRG